MSQDLPSWLHECKESLLKTPQWQHLTRDVYSDVRKRLDKANVQFFADLSAEERRLFIDQTEQSLQKNGTYVEFLKILKKTVDRGVSNDVSKEIRLAVQDEQDGVLKTSRSELMMTKLAAGAAKLLRSLPHGRNEVSVLLNHEFPTLLRREAWKLYLSNVEARSMYVKKLETRRLATISNIDVEITQKCETFLEQNLPELSQGMGMSIISAAGKRISLLMKVAISYYHTMYGTDPDWVYHLIVPIACVYGGVSGSKLSASDFGNEGSVDVIESLFALIELERPRFVLTTIVGDELASRDELASEICGLLGEKDPVLLEHLKRVMNDEEDKDSTSLSPEVRTTSLIAPCVEGLWVGILPLDVTCFLWDQCLMVGFKSLVGPVCACVLMVLREQLLEKDTPSQLSKIMITRTRSIRLRELQACMEKEIMPRFRREFKVRRHDFDELFYEDDSSFGQGVHSTSISESLGGLTLNDREFLGPSNDQWEDYIDEKFGEGYRLVSLAGQGEAKDMPAQPTHLIASIVSYASPSPLIPRPPTPHAHKQLQATESVSAKMHMGPSAEEVKADLAARMARRKGRRKKGKEEQELDDIEEKLEKEYLLKKKKAEEEKEAEEARLAGIPEDEMIKIKFKNKDGETVALRIQALKEGDEMNDEALALERVKAALAKAGTKQSKKKQLKILERLKKKSRKIWAEKSSKEGKGGEGDDDDDEAEEGKDAHDEEETKEDEENKEEDVGDHEEGVSGGGDAHEEGEDKDKVKEGEEEGEEERPKQEEDKEEEEEKENGTDESGGGKAKSKEEEKQEEKEEDEEEEEEGKEDAQDRKTFTVTFPESELGAGIKFHKAGEVEGDRLVVKALIEGKLAITLTPKIEPECEVIKVNGKEVEGRKNALSAIKAMLGERPGTVTFRRTAAGNSKDGGEDDAKAKEEKEKEEAEKKRKEEEAAEKKRKEEEEAKRKKEEEDKKKKKSTGFFW